MHLNDRKILLALDGSQFSETAIETTAGLARRLQAQLHIIQVVPPLLTTTPELFPYLDQELSQQIQAEVHHYLEGLLPRFSGIDYQLHNPIGSPRELITQTAQEQGCRLVVMASHGRTGMARWLLGSTAEYVLRHVESSVLLLRPHALPSIDGNFKRVLIPIDGSPAAQEVIAKIGPYLAANAQVTVMRATGLSARDYTLLDNPHEIERYIQHLQDQLKQLDNHGITLEHQVVDGQAADSILQLAEQKQCDLIALSTHGRSGFRRFILGSVTEKVARQAACPVLAFPYKAVAVKD